MLQTQWNKLISLINQYIFHDYRINITIFFLKGKQDESWFFLSPNVNNYYKIRM